ncbi:MAG: hypothetical protein AB1782_20640 [Cyanobacteriota bacterium]
MNIFSKHNIKIVSAFFALILLVSCNQPQTQIQKPLDQNINMQTGNSVPKEVVKHEVLSDCVAQGKKGPEHYYIVYIETDVDNNPDKAFDDVKIVGDKLFEEMKPKESQYKFVQYLYFDDKSNLPEPAKLCENIMSIYSDYKLSYVGHYASDTDPENKSSSWSINKDRKK